MHDPEKPHPENTSMIHHENKTFDVNKLKRTSQMVRRAYGGDGAEIEPQGGPHPGRDGVGHKKPPPATKVGGRTSLPEVVDQRRGGAITSVG